MVPLNSPYKVIKVLATKKYPGYIYRRELIDDSFYGGSGGLKISCCYDEITGQWIGDPKMARFLYIKMGIRDIEGSIGFNEQEQKWYGWSHRAICGFGIGDKLFEEDYGDEDTLFVEHGRVEIFNLDQAKQAALNFAAYVS